MLIKYSSLPERLITEGAIIRFFPGVYPHVLLEVSWLSKQFTTVMADVGSVTAVGALVLLQAATELEALATHIALEWLVLLVIFVVVN